MDRKSEIREVRIAYHARRLIDAGWPAGDAILWSVEHFSTEMWLVST
jgi:hypothetical protein